MFNIKKAREREKEIYKYTQSCTKFKNFQKKLNEKINNIQSFFINDNKKENISPDANSLTKKIIIRF